MERADCQHTSSTTVLLDNSGSLTRSHFTSMCCICFSEDQIPHGFPTINMGPQLKVVEKTHTATMLCAASGNPDPEIHWFKDFLPVDLTNSRIKQLRSGEAPFSLCWLSALMMAFWYLGPHIYTVYTVQPPTRTRSVTQCIRGFSFLKLQMIRDAIHQAWDTVETVNKSI